MAEAVTVTEPVDQPRVAPDLYGEYRFKVDSKGRVALPAKFRKVLSSDLMVALEPSGQCLYVFERADFKDWLDRLFVDGVGGYNSADLRHQKAMRRIRANTNDVEVDGSGRIMISADLRAKAGIEKDVVINGNAEHFEIWDAKRYEDEDDGDLSFLYHTS